MDYKQRLGEVYSNHHTKKGRYGYLFCDGQRGSYLKDWIGTGKRVLDLGCRDGMLTQFFAEGNAVTGVDIDSKALEIMQKRLQVEACWLDLNTEWPFACASFDVIIACEILEHLFFPEAILKNIAKSLKDGGMFIGSVPNSFRMRNRIKFFFGEEFDCDATHLRWFSYQKLQDMLEEYFFDIEIIPLQGKIAPFFPVSQRYPKAVTRLFAKDFLWKCTKIRR